jgi:CDP-glucose 4,6-dehydratase
VAGMVIDREFWNGRRVFLTGHTGFKGAWLSLWLMDLGAKVFGFSLDPPSTPNLFTAGRVDEGLTNTHGDIRDLAAIKAAIATASPDIVMHLAAQSLVRTSYQDPVGTFSTNVLGTVHVLEAVCSYNATRAQDSKIAATLVVTSDKCYDNKEWPWGYRESDPLGGHDPYSSSKGCAELVSASYLRSFASNDSGRVGMATARAGNVIGGGDWALDRLVPDAMRAFATGTELVIRNPAAVRPWQHVLEPIGAYLLLTQRMLNDPASFSGPWNFGPDPTGRQSVAVVTDGLVKHWGDNAHWKAGQGVQPHEAGLLSLDCSKAQMYLRWRPRLSLDDALRLTVDWYRAHLANPNRSMRDYTLGQIRDFAY